MGSAPTGSSMEIVVPRPRGLFSVTRAPGASTRAAAGLDRDHDAEDRRAGRRIGCPLLVLWGAGGPLDTWYAAAGGPLALWRGWADDVRGHAVPAGHFFPEERPAEVAAALRRFLTGRPQ